MVRVMLWLFFPLVVFLLRQSNGASAQCSELQSKISRLENELLNITEQKQKYKIFLDTCYERLEIGTKRLNSQELVEYQFKNQLQQSEAVNQNLTKQLEAKEVILKSKDEEMKRLTTDKDGLTKKVQSLNQRVSQLERQTRNASKPTRVYNNDPGKEKALLFAAKSGDTAKARSLVEEGTNVNVRDDSVYHLTPLITAAMCDYVEVVQMLLEGGANLEDPASASGNTALHQAASAGSLEACRLLLDEGANVDALNFSKNTPLHLAAVNGHMPVVKLLVERGADVRRKNVLNDTPREGVGKRKEGCGKMVVFDTLYAKFSLGVFALQNTLLQKSFFCQNKADRHSASFFSYE